MKARISVRGLLDVSLYCDACDGAAQSGEAKGWMSVCRYWSRLVLSQLSIRILYSDLVACIESGN